jgi:hypothetical protein
VRGNEGGGAVVTGYSAPVFSEDRFSDNGFVAVGVKEHSTVLIFFLFFFCLVAVGVKEHSTVLIFFLILFLLVAVGVEEHSTVLNLLALLAQKYKY